MGRAIDRRELLAGGGGLVICTLAGQKIRADGGEADVAALGAELPVPPKVREGAVAPAAAKAARRGPVREYWIKAENTVWDIVPTRRDQMTGTKIRGKTTFNGYAYRAYTAGFGAPLGPAAIPGPLLDVTVGETLIVNFRNELDAPVTMHPHGVFYTEPHDGAFKGRFSSPGGFVQPGKEWQYVWEAREGTEGFWIYHDHGPLDPLPLFKGLFGPLIVRKSGTPAPDHEFFVGMHSFQPVATGLGRPFYCLNGRSYAGNTETLRASVGGRVAFNVYALDDAFHTFHLHGHRWEDRGKIVDNVVLGPADSLHFEFVEDNPGRWFYHCHVFSHLHQGMNGWYITG